MAGRLVSVCLSQYGRRAPQTIPRFYDHYPSHFLSARLGSCFDSSNHSRQLGFPEPFYRSFTSISPFGCVVNLFSISTVSSQLGCRSLVSWNRREVGWPGMASGQTFSNSSSDLAIEEDETVRPATEIGYEVVGQYISEGPRIKPQAAFAVVQVGSHQFKVTPGDMIYTEKLKHAVVNDKLLLNKVLLMGSLRQTIIGRPTIPEAGVLAAVEEIALDAKVIVFKKKRRKNYRRTAGHRQELTRLRILQIKGIEAPTSASDDVRLEENL